MRDIIIGLLDAIKGSLVWANSIVAFIESEETRLVSHEAGTYKASDLLAELKIRLKSVKGSGINAIGMTELVDTLCTISGEEIIRNYIFKSDKQTGIVYVDEKCTKLIGAVLVDAADNKATGREGTGA
jgi:hypothetical protein